MISKGTFIAKILLLIAAAHQIIFSLAVPLSVKNSLAGLARDNVPVQMGIPFPQGKLAVADVSKLTISDSITGAALPAGITSTVVWHDGSVRWVRAMFPATVASSSKTTYMLTDNGKSFNGTKLPSGVYTVTLKAGHHKIDKKLVIIR